MEKKVLISFNLKTFAITKLKKGENMKSKVVYLVLSCFIIGLVVLFVGFTSVPLHAVDPNGPTPPVSWFDDAWYWHRIDCSESYTVMVQVTWPYAYPPPPEHIKAEEISCLSGGNEPCISLPCYEVIRI